MSKTPSLLILLLLSAFACQEARQAAPAAAPPETLESFVLRETGVDLSGLNTSGFRKAKSALEDTLKIRLNTPLAYHPCLVLEDLISQQFFIDCGSGMGPFGNTGVFLSDTNFLLGTRKPVVVPDYFRQNGRLIEDLLNSRYRARQPDYAEVKDILEAIAFPHHPYQYTSDDQQVIDSWRTARKSIMGADYSGEEKEALAAYVDGAFSQLLSRSSIHREYKPGSHEFRYFSDWYFFQVLLEHMPTSGFGDTGRQTRYRYFIQIERIPLYY